MKDQFDFIYYRGSLDFCNYKCEYCPFSKSSANDEKLEIDRFELKRFVEKIRENESALSIFFIPYGEALIHKYYMQTIAELSCRENIKGVGIQTNNSFSVDMFNSIIKEYGASKEKLRLWCSFHPSQIDVDSFYRQCEKIIESDIAFSVGAVAISSNLGMITELREKLPSQVYLWLNRADGAVKDYTEEEIAKFTSIDPYFQLEVTRPKSDFLNCSAGKTSVLVNANGKLVPCVYARSSFGNFYTERRVSEFCRSGACNCFISYSNRENIELLNRFGEEKRFRMPKAETKSVYCFDVDGTLLDHDGNISDEIHDKIKRMSESEGNILLLNTALPYEIAFKKCQKIWELLSGGAFDLGSDIRFFNPSYIRNLTIDVSMLPENLLKKALNGITLNKNSNKIVFFRQHLSDEEGILLNENFHVEYQRQYVYVVHRDAGKTKSQIFFSRFFFTDEKRLFMIGNSENDEVKFGNCYIAKNSGDVSEYLQNTLISEDR